MMFFHAFFSVASIRAITACVWPYFMHQMSLKMTKLGTISIFFLWSIWIENTVRVCDLVICCLIFATIFFVAVFFVPSISICITAHVMITTIEYTPPIHWWFYFKCVNCIFQIVCSKFQARKKKESYFNLIFDVWSRAAWWWWHKSTWIIAIHILLLNYNIIYAILTQLKGG